MTSVQKLSLFLVRIAMGWFYFYAGYTKIIDQSWSAAGYINNAKSFKPFFSLLADPSILPIIDFLNKWGLTLLGISLIIGLFVRFSSSLGVIVMLLYYLALDFPHPNPNAYIVDQHIIYSLMLVFLGQQRAGQFLGLDKICDRFPKFLRKILG